MTSKEYVIWLQGFVEACHDYAPTPKQWDALKDKLAEVKDETTSTPVFPFGTPNTGTIQTLPFIQPIPSDPYNPYKITSVLTTTSGSGGIYTYNPSTSTAYGYPSGSAWSYTLNTNRWQEHQAKMADYKPYQPYTTGGDDEVIKHHNED